MALLAAVSMLSTMLSKCKPGTLLQLPCYSAHAAEAASLWQYHFYSVAVEAACAGRNRALSCHHKTACFPQHHNTLVTSCLEWVQTKMQMHVKQAVSALPSVLTGHMCLCTKQMMSTLQANAQRPSSAAGGLLDYDAVSSMLDSEQIGALGLDVQWQEPWDPEHFITNHPKYGAAHVLCCFSISGLSHLTSVCCLHLLSLRVLQL